MNLSEPMHGFQRIDFATYDMKRFFDSIRTTLSCSDPARMWYMHWATESVQRIKPNVISEEMPYHSNFKATVCFSPIERCQTVSIDFSTMLSFTSGHRACAQLLKSVHTFKLTAFVPRRFSKIILLPHSCDQLILPHFECFSLKLGLQTSVMQRRIWQGDSKFPPL